jgi:hypothetical protein
VTVTLPVHPFCGMALVLLRQERGQDGRRSIVAEHPSDGGHLRLPIEWTDRGRPWSAPRVKGQQVRVGVRALLALAAAVEAVQLEKLDLSRAAAAPSSQAEQTDSRLDSPAGRVVGSVGDDTARPARSMGVPAAKDSPSPRRHRGPR